MWKREKNELHKPKNQMLEQIGWKFLNTSTTKLFPQCQTA